MYEHTVRKISDLIPYANNSRTHSDEQVQQIASSMKEFGFTNPILLDEENGIIAGHGRVLAARLLGWQEAPCIILSGFTETQKKAYVIADNKLAENAGWDDKMLSLELKTLEELEFDIGILGFEDGELDKLLKPDITDGKTDDDAVPDITDEPVSKPGDLWILGEHRLFCGDGTEKASIETVLGGELIDLYLTDPPYNVDYSAGLDTKGKQKTDGKGTQNDAMSAVEFREFLRDAFSGALHFMKPGAVFYIWHTDIESYNVHGACIDAGIEIKQTLIWKKQNFSLGRQDYQWMHEPCLYGWKSGAKHLWASDRKQSTILTFDRPMRTSEHPTMKPVELFLYQILNNTKGKDIIFDNFAGSGTTLIACEKSNRRARVIELDPCYVDIIIARWEDYTGDKAIHAITKKPFRRGTRSKSKNKPNGSENSKTEDNSKVA